MARRRRLTQERLNEIAILVHEQHWTIDQVWDQLMPGERRDLLRMASNAAEQDRQRDHERMLGEPARRARRLLLSFLSPGQRIHLWRRHHVRVVGSEGGRYRIWESGQVEAVEERGGRWLGRWTFCWHSEDRREWLPAGDMVVAAILLLQADEGRFLAEANATPVRHRRGEWVA